MSEQRHPDIEVYIKNRSLETVLEWLGTRCDTVRTLNSVGGTHALEVSLNNCSIPVMIHEKAVGKAWISIWFRSDKTPWARDIDCAHEVADALDTQVRCIAESWSESSDADEEEEWWRVENGNAEKIRWPNS
ncbi:hypothetical protein ADIMK_1181 [Marinobacterium lacunae]|uniref:Uncharacterized protein n=1 Tax=Marinobacterium lacunae TaxID=1232683 RepID=A0A081G1S3_9GAMM|nr:hypothetical protein [Marinobacterium lacunae]KEA64728.1 hypothetical protein ADIMK_1181 [Marinobacterium lacunae]MBR9882690.1 hypothetical protein [Oceanospirillales bacterium]